ncbi:MAG TPA: LPS assembly lipoprotein LptE [Steroidobacteraceae bacterium]|jgi:LPS-assembly lipoprotein|nr:LPS assembly lipoprotein LptE [Steroidobacteraceae bacterium]
MTGAPGKRCATIRAACSVGALAVAALSAGCGFHLEGRTPLPAAVKTPYLETEDRQSDFVQSLRRALLMNGAQLSPRKDKASAVVTILKDSIKQRVLSVSNLNEPNEYELTYTVSFSVTAGEQELLAPQELSTTRDYSFDPHLLLAKGHEADVLRGAMAQDLADMVMRRLARL